MLTLASIHDPTLQETLQTRVDDNLRKTLQAFIEDCDDSNEQFEHYSFVCNFLFSVSRPEATTSLHCYHITRLPDIFGHACIRHVQSLCLLNACFVELPPSMLSMNLSFLDISGNKYIRKLPEDLQKWHNMRHLDIDDCSRLQASNIVPLSRLPSLCILRFQNTCFWIALQGANTDVRAPNRMVITHFLSDPTICAIREHYDSNHNEHLRQLDDSKHSSE